MSDYGPSSGATHDFNPATGLSREQYRDAWMSSGVNTIQGQQDWMAKNGGQVLSGNGMSMTPYGDMLDMQIGARTGNGQPGWTNTGAGGGNPNSNFNQQQNFEMTGAQQATNTAPGNQPNQLQNQQPQQNYAGSNLQNQMNSGMNSVQNNQMGASPYQFQSQQPMQQQNAYGWNQPSGMSSGIGMNNGMNMPMNDRPLQNNQSYAAPQNNNQSTNQPMNQRTY